MAKIEYQDDFPVFVHTVDGCRYSFTVLGFNSDKYDWLCRVLGRQMDEIHTRAVATTEKRIRQDIKKALGL